MFSKKIPPCPGNPEDYVLVRTKEGSFWRRKRGSIRGVVLNSAFQKSAEATKIVSPAAKRVLLTLHPYLRGLETGRLNTRIGNALRKSLKEKNELQICYLRGVELQRDHPLHRLLKTQPGVYCGLGELRIKLDIDSYTINPLNTLVTDYYFEAVILFGDITRENGLETRSVESQLYALEQTIKTKCVLELPLPEKGDWCLLLKVSMLEGNKLAVHPKHYGMKFIASSEEFREKTDGHMRQR